MSKSCVKPILFFSFFWNISPKRKYRCLGLLFVQFSVCVFPQLCEGLNLGVGAPRRSLLKTSQRASIFSPCAQAVISPAGPKVGTWHPHCQLNSNQQTKMEWDIELHPISSPILKPVFASHKLAYKLRLRRREKSRLPDNNEATSCRRLDASVQLGSSFLPSLDVRRSSFGWASTIHFDLHPGTSY